MADLAPHDDPSHQQLQHEEHEQLNSADNRGNKRKAVAPVDDDDDDDEKPGRERRKIDIKFIVDKSRRHITFSKRKAGIMKKAYELSVLTGTQVLLLVVSETGLVYTFTTPKLQPLVTKHEGKNLIQACLNAPSPSDSNGLEGDQPVDQSPEEANHQQVPPSMRGPPPPGMPGPYGMSPQDHMAYQNYLQQSQQQGGMPPQGMPPQGMGGQYPVPPARMGGQHPQGH